MQTNYKNMVSSMSLGNEQRKFTRAIGLLINYAYQEGCELTFGDAYRDPRTNGAIGERKAYGAANSNHKRRISVDFNLFIGGKYITDSSNPMWIKLHTFFETIGGAKMIPNDANHFSFEWQGQR